MNKILLGSIVTLALFTGCSDEKKEATAIVNEKVEVKKDEVVGTETTKEITQVISETANDVKDSVVELSTNVSEKATEVVKEVTNEVLNDNKEVIDTTKDKASEVMEKTVEKVDEIKEQLITVVEDSKEKIEEASSQLTDSVITEEKEEVKLDGKVLYASCASCHGQNAEKQALGKSQVIAGWDKEKIIAALNGYKDGSYGGVMKNIMKGQVSSKSDEEIEAIADFVSNL
uniref:c-type cytochrome n=1 Tax=Aliarcobacter sp. TaxID=2321116 RepID=UPI004047EC14